MERFSYLSVGTDELNWGSSLGEFIQNGLDADGDVTKGTPKKKNSISHKIVNGSLVYTDVTLTQENSPYIIPRGGLIIQAGSTLTALSGVVIKLVTPNEPSIIVNGTFITQGTEDSPVVITSFKDDVYGGDFNGDGVCDSENASSTASCPSPGNWKQIVFGSTSNNSSLLSTIIRYGGRWFKGMIMKAAVIVNSVDVDFQNVIVENSSYHGLYMNESESVINNSIFRDNDMEPSSSGIYIAGGAPTISNSSFVRNSFGVYDNSLGASLISNVFSDNSDKAVVANAYGIYKNNTGSGNGKNAIALASGLTKVNADPNSPMEHSTTTLYVNSLPYLLDSYAYPRVYASTTLAFEDGVVIKSDNKNIVINDGGRVYHNGFSADDLIFTSYNDNSVSGTINPTASTSTIAQWGGFKVLSGGFVNLSGFTLRHAGADGKYGGNNITAGFRLFGDNSITTMMTLSNGVIENHGQFGVSASDGARFELSDITIKNQIDDLFSPASAVYLIDSDFVGERVNFEDNVLDIKLLGNSNWSCVDCIGDQGGGISVEE